MEVLYGVNTNRIKVLFLSGLVLLVIIGAMVLLYPRPKRIVINSGMTGDTTTVALHLCTPKDLRPAFVQDQKSHNDWRNLSVNVKVPIMPGATASQQNINEPPGYHVAPNLEIGTSKEYTITKFSNEIFDWYKTELSHQGYHLEITTAGQHTQMRAFRSKDGTTFIWVLVTPIPGTMQSELSFSIEYLIPGDNVQIRY